jgi:hypothetical protein
MPAIRCSIHEEINECGADEWDEIVGASRSGILMSHGFVAAVEDAFEDQARFEHAVVYDEGRAVACASFCSIPIDFNLLADGFARRITEVISKRVPSLMRRTIVFCGLPVSVGAKHLAIAPGARHEDVLRAMHEIAVSFARRERAPYIAFKEFLAGDRPKLDFLQQLGYRRFSSPAMNTFNRWFPDMDSYTAALRSCYRQCVRKSLAKSRAADLRYVRLTDTDAILRLYGPTLHRLTRRSLSPRRIASSFSRSRSSTAWRGDYAVGLVLRSSTPMIALLRSTGISFMKKSITGSSPGWTTT